MVTKAGDQGYNDALYRCARLGQCMKMFGRDVVTRCREKL